jgi:hypothetical protein
MALSNVSPSCYETSLVVLHFRLRLHRSIQNAQQLVVCETCRGLCMRTISGNVAKFRLVLTRSEPASIWTPCEDPLLLNNTRTSRQTAGKYDITAFDRNRLTSYSKFFACPTHTYPKDGRLTPSLNRAFFLSKVTGSRYCNFQHSSIFTYKQPHKPQRTSYPDCAIRKDDSFAGLVAADRVGPFLVHSRVVTLGVVD